MKNPFVYGREVTRDDFCNRTDEIKELIREIENCQNVIIFSQRRFGKTSLIKRVFNELDSSDIITVYVDLYPVLTEEDFIRIYARAVSEVITRGLMDRIKDLGSVFKRLRPEFIIDQNGQSRITIDFKKKEILPFIEDVLEGLNRYVEKENNQAVVCFDEFQQITQLKTDQLEKYMRSIFQTHEKISYVFMGSKKHLIHDAFNNPNRPFYRSARPLPLGKIDSEELISFIKNKFEDSGKTIADSLAGRVISECESHPYYVQYLCHILWEKVIDKKRVTEKDFMDSLEILLERESSAFMATWDPLTVQQKQVLIALAKAGKQEQILASDFRAEYNLGAASSVQRTVESLLDKDLIDKTNGAYSIIDVIFKKWIITHYA
ncbi:MAG: ATP-binding protein [Candidatus Krumholzibacteriales bacterium]